MIRQTTLLLCLLLCAPIRAGELPAPASDSPSVLTSNTDGFWDSETFVYDGAGNIIGIGDDVYTYDSLGRIERAGVNSSLATTTDSYKYDAFGNLYERKVDGPAGLSTLPMPVQWGTNQLMGATYDDAGNMEQHGAAHRYQWDAMRMLSSRNDGQDVYIYTGSDERIAVKNGETWKWSLRDPSGKVLREMESTGPTGTWRWVEDFVHRDGQVVAAERPAAKGGRRHMHLDHLGTPRLLTDAGGLAISRHDYLPFAIELTSNHQEGDRGYAENKLRFTGHERDFVGGTASENVDTLDYMHARYYRSEIGRFLSVDPALDLETALREPQQWNRYSYVVNNPLKYTDPDGKDKFMAWLLGSAFRDVSTWDALKGALSPAGMTAAINEGRQEWAEDHRAATNGWSPVPTTKTEVGMQMLMMGPVGKFIGTSFGKLGTVIANEAGKITGISGHAINQIITRGMSPAVLRSVTSNPTVVLAQSGGRKLFLTSEGAVVLDKAGKVITVYTKKDFDKVILNVLDQATRAIR